MDENDFNDNFSDNFNDNHDIIEEFVSAQEDRDAREVEAESLEVRHSDEMPRRIKIEEAEDNYNSEEPYAHRETPTSSARQIHVSEDPIAIVSEQTEETEQIEKTTPKPEKTQKPKKCGRGKFAAGLLGALIGLLVGGVGVYTALVLLKAPKECPNTCDEAPTEDPLETPATSKKDNAYDFLKLETANQNLIYSPLSINSALSLLSAGAMGETKTEIDNVIGDAKIPKYQNIPDQLSLANAVFIRNEFKDSVYESYISTVTTNNNADIIFDDFESAEIFNDWASEKTFGLINSLGITPTDDTQMVLANALAIQMDWEHPFDAAYDDTFYLSNEEIVNIPTLHETFGSDDITYIKNDDATILTLPLDSTSENAELEFVAVLPTGNLDEYIKKADIEDLNKQLAKATRASDTEAGVMASIPKFKFDYELNFMNNLETLGMTSAFNPLTANFSKLASTPLSVGAAVHKANIEFSETGIKAAAVTSFGMETNAMPIETAEPIAIIFDRPFLFLIRDRANEAVWFVGTVYNPAE